jgi:polar amino acid transport system substrate-binding protein
VIRKHAWIGVAIAIAASVLASCSAGSSKNAKPPTTTPTTAAAAAADTSCDPVKSIAPSGPLPTPGAMPGNSYMAAIQKRGYLTAGVAADTLQFGFEDPKTAQIKGFDIDMVHEVAKAIFPDAIFPDGIDVNHRVKLVPMAYSGRIPALQNGTVDIVADVMTMNCARWKLIDFSSQYYEASQKVLVPYNSTAKSINDLNGRTVCVAAKSTGQDYLEQLKSPKLNLKVVNDISDCMVLFQQGLVDAVNGDDTVLTGFAKQDPYAKVLPDRLTHEPYGLGINQHHSDFVQFVNGVLDNVRANGRWQQMYSQWVGGSANPPTAQYGRPAQP